MAKRKSSIRKKVQFVLGLLLLLVIFLTGTGVYAVRLYRETVQFVGERARDELPIVVHLGSEVAQMRMVVSELKGLQKDRGAQYLSFSPPDFGLGNMFRVHLNNVQQMQQQYQRLLEEEFKNQKKYASYRHQELDTLIEMGWKLQSLAVWVSESTLSLNDRDLIYKLDETSREIQILADKLPEYLKDQFLEYSNDMRAKYRFLITTVCISAFASTIVLAMLLRLSYVWIFQPMRELVIGSRMVAQGRFNVRIKLDAQDEMKELADAFNQMTDQFEAVRNDLDQQVQIRTKEAVQTERLASVGFLAAGVAHEINNPLASIAMCAESLERRLLPFVRKLENDGKKTSDASEVEIIERYLDMIQEEAFRCKGITEKLLDFARMERKSREMTDLSELTVGVVEMLNHLGKYRSKHIKLDISESVHAMVNPQEMKQVTLNLLTNALDSVEEGGIVWVRLFEREEVFHLVIEDNGCGMDSEIMRNVFEPFFTKRHNGQGTGLGLSITHRIITEHQGRIEAYSAGLGKGAVFQVEIPLHSPEAERLAAMKSKELFCQRERRPPVVTATC